MNLKEIESKTKKHTRDMEKVDSDKINRPYDIMLGISKNMRLWQRVAGLLMILLTISVGVNFMIFSRKPLVPYIVAITQQGEVLDLGEVQYHRTDPTEQQLSYFLRKTIKNLREVPESQERFELQLAELSNFMSKPVLTKLWNVDLRERENMLRVGDRRFIEIKTITKLKDQPAFTVRWVEITIDSSGTVTGRKFYQGMVSVSLKDVTDIEVLKVNPLGLYIEDMTTSLDEI